jgi:osmotically-inducible protein OsmY
MSRLAMCSVFFVLLVAGGCSSSSSKPTQIAADIRKALDQTGLRHVSVSQDQKNGVIVLDGYVDSEADKLQAQALAKTIADPQVVAVQIAVIPADNEEPAKTILADLDQGMEKNLDAALLESGLHSDVRYRVKNGVVTLTGTVDSDYVRTQAERIAGTVPNVQQVVNELQVKSQKASVSQ